MWWRIFPEFQDNWLGDLFDWESWKVRGGRWGDGKEEAEDAAVQVLFCYFFKISWFWFCHSILPFTPSSKSLFQIPGLTWVMRTLPGKFSLYFISWRLHSYWKVKKSIMMIICEGWTGCTCLKSSWQRTIARTLSTLVFIGLQKRACFFLVLNNVQHLRVQTMVALTSSVLWSCSRGPMRWLWPLSRGGNLHDFVSY